MDTYPPPQNKQTNRTNLGATEVGTTDNISLGKDTVKADAAAVSAAAPAADAECLTLDELYFHLNKVSRSFAITIPFMRKPLRDQVALAYLLCRIVDTVEDDATAPINEKITWLSDFSFLADDEFADEDVLHSLKVRALDLTRNGSAADDINLVANLERAVHLLQTFEDEVQEVICHAAAILAHGMATSLRNKRDQEEISSLDDVDNYCYSVAGVVGELLEEVFGLADRRADEKDQL